MRLTAPLYSLLCAATVFGASYEDWQRRSIYQLVTDRFATSDGSSPACNTSARQYCNGTWQGVISKLDYIQNMGFDAIWISPIVANLAGDTGDGAAYHGYWTVDQTSLNDHFGTDGDLKLLSTTLHEHGMFLMVDVVVNHMAAPLLTGTANSSDPSAPAPAVNYAAFTPFNNESSFHPFCWITDDANQTDVEQCWLGDAAVPLADVDTENPDVVAFFNSWIADLVTTYGIDGLRIDTVKNVRKDFWPAFAQSADVWSIGEVYDGDVAYVANYSEVLDAVLDYPSFYPLTRGFQNSSGDLTQLAASVGDAQHAYRLGTFMTGSFLENQDNPRFPSLTTDQSLIVNAMTWVFVQDGVPILYYGQEQGYAGADDPYNREALWLSGYEEDKPLVVHVRALNAARKAAIAWDNATFLGTPVAFPVASASQLAVSKQPLLALLTNAGASSSPSWSVPSTNYSKGDELIDVLSCSTTKVGDSGAVAWTGSSGMPAVLLPTSVFNASYCNALKNDISGDTGSPWVAQSAGEELRLSTAGTLVAASLTILFFAVWMA
ncbi:alpha-amylase [Rhodofomes roseus]|uniref:alpha-amylase n=1 Tax=Rhodofomes roseus TaxID=34475 RepID=A0ABQ8KHU3_9APHY|nr:alpha-amylase [Rhodofomes roseus]KAH9837571.1 alpha-amylase [Rhodofomes roseus]